MNLKLRAKVEGPQDKDKHKECLYEVASSPRGWMKK